MRNRVRAISIVVAILALIAAAIVVLALVWDPLGYRSIPREFEAVFSKGESIDVVLKKAAQKPDLTLLEEVEGPAPSDRFAITGWKKPPRAATYRVYIWSVRGVMLAYVFVEHDRRVSDVFWAGS